VGSVVVVQFITVDGVVEDPDGRGGTTFGGWAMRHGPEGVSGDRFGIAPLLERGTLLFGRRSWDHFRHLWPTRDDPFSRTLNSATKAVATHRDIDPAAWSNSHRIDGPLLPWTAAARAEADVVVIGSGDVVQQLAEADAVDEYRLLVFPTAVGEGRRLFPGPKHLALRSAEQVGPSTLTIYDARVDG
jgi:dihydrofolate reductase